MLFVKCFRLYTSGIAWALFKLIMDKRYSDSMAKRYSSSFKAISLHIS